MKDPAIPFAPWRIPGILDGSITETHRPILPKCKIGWTFPNSFFYVLHYPTILCEVIELGETRLQDLTDESMQASGVHLWPHPFEGDLRSRFKHVWDMTSGILWHENPSVRIVKFRRADL